MKKSGWLILGLVGSSAALLLGWLLLFTPFKVTDPDDPRFDPLQFKFSDYKRDTLVPALKKIFSPGDSKEFVEKVLVNSGNARPEQHSSNFFIYVWTFPLGYAYTNDWLFITPDTLYSVSATYDNQNKLTGMKMLGHEIFNNIAILKTLDKPKELRLNQDQQKE